MKADQRERARERERERERGHEKNLQCCIGQGAFDYTSSHISSLKPAVLQYCWPQSRARWARGTAEPTELRDKDSEETLYRRWREQFQGSER